MSGEHERKRTKEEGKEPRWPQQASCWSSWKADKLVTGPDCSKGKRIPPHTHTFQEQPGVAGMTETSVLD